MSATLLSTPSPDDGDSRQQAIVASIVQMVAITHLLLDDDTRLERDEAHIAEIAADFERRRKEFPAEHPVQTPLRVVKRGPKWLIIAGAYRYLASLRIGLEAIPCISLGHDVDAAGKLVEQFADNQRHKPYTPMEQARAILELRRLRPDLSQGRAAATLGIRDCDAAKVLKIINFYPADLHPLIGEGDGFVPFTSAYHLARLMEKTKDEAKVRELTDKVVKGWLSRDDLVVLVNTLLGKREKKPKALKISFGGVVATVKEATAFESLLAFAAKIPETIKRMQRDHLPPGILPAILKS